MKYNFLLTLTIISLITFNQSYSADQQEAKEIELGLRGGWDCGKIKIKRDEKINDIIQRIRGELHIPVAYLFIEYEYPKNSLNLDQNAEESGLWSNGHAYLILDLSATISLPDGRSIQTTLPGTTWDLKDEILKDLQRNDLITHQDFQNASDVSLVCNNREIDIVDEDGAFLMIYKAIDFTQIPIITVTLLKE